jgi:hypothetical protein
VDTPIVVALIALGTAAVTAVFAWRSSGRATDVNERAAELAWVKEIRQDAIDARKDVEALQAKVQTLSRQVDTITREAEYWMQQYQLVHRTVWRRGMTLERVRDFLGPEPPKTVGQN